MAVQTDRCAGCAFRPDTQASQTDLTVWLARLSVLLGDVFFCHEGLAPGTEPTTLCAGWYAAHAQRYHAGYYRLLPDWKRAVLGACMETVQAAIDRNLDGTPLADDEAVALLEGLIAEVGEEFRHEPDGAHARRAGPAGRGAMPLL